MGKPGRPKGSDNKEKIDPRRYWSLWKTALLSHLLVRICTGIDQDGERAEFVSESDKDLRSMRQVNVLPDK